MEKFLKNCVLLSFIMLAAIFLITQIRFSDQFIIQKTKDTAYKKVAWNLNVINNRPDEIEGSILFFGSSLIQVGISDSLLIANGYHSFNFGVNHSGNELGLYFLKRVSSLKPKAIYVLKRKTLRTGNHKLTPLLYRPLELLNDGQSINLYFFSYLFQRAKFSFDYLFFGIYKDKNNIPVYGKYGQLITEGDMGFSFANRFEMDKKYDELVSLPKNDFKYSVEKSTNSVFIQLKIWRRKLFLHFERIFQNGKSQENFKLSAVAICNTNGINFNSIYVPISGDHRRYSGYERLLFRPAVSDKNVLLFDNFNFLSNEAYWADANHLSYDGALKFTEKIIDQFDKEKPNTTNVDNPNIRTADL
tara:strand:+ start:274 stop:1350 length:1077 start_codon:yes stop_codon:yes gene_type:complete